jgi:osmotically-inducible protein OsmY
MGGELPILPTWDCRLLEDQMKTTKVLVAALSLLTIGTLAGCWGTSSKSPDVSGTIRKSLDQAGLKDVTISQNREQGIVTLGGHVTNPNDKAQAESLAKSFAGAQVVADQIAVVPAGQGQEVSAVNSDLDEGIEKNLDAALIQNNMHRDVNYKVKNGVVTLSGQVDSEGTRKGAESLAIAVPNVLQVVNDLQIKNMKASSGQ